MGVTLGVQTGALFRKNWVYQKRSCCTNVCLLSTPIVFCVLLLIIQTVINQLLLSQDSFKCGCKCLDCQYTDASGAAISGSYEKYGVCPGSCKSYDKATCGLKYSTAVQATYCAVASPNSWPVVQQLPKPASRWTSAAERSAQSWQRLPYFLYAGTGMAAADSDAYATELFAAPALDPASGAHASLVARITALQAYLTTAKADTANAAILGEVFSLIGLTIGSSSVASSDLYSEVALIAGRNQNPELLAPVSTCALGTGAAYTAAGVLSPNRGTTRTIRSLIEALDPVLGPPLYAALPTDMRNIFEDTTSGNISCNSVTLGGNLAYKATKVALEETLYCGYFNARCAGAVNTYNEIAGGFDFRDTSATKFNVALYFNNTDETASNRPMPYQRIVSMLDRATNAWLTKNGYGIARMIGSMSMPKAASSLKLDFSSLLGALFFSWVVQTLLPFFLLQLVYDKEKKLRTMMKLHGLGDTAYWIIMYSWYLLLYVCYIILLLIFGSVVGLSFFRQNNYGVQIIFYFLFGNNMIAFAFLLSCLFKSSRTAIVSAFLYVFATGLIGDLLLKNFIQADAWYMWLIELIPGFALYRGLYEFGAYSFLGVYRNSTGMTPANLRDKGNGLGICFAIFIVEWCIFIPLAWYLEQVYDESNGIRKHPLFFLPSVQRKQAAAEDRAAASAALDVADELEDVAAERERVEALTPADCAAHTPIVVKHLQKVYPGVDGGPPKLAVRQLTVGIERGECFGLLGPNGAGKSTSINMMVGFLEPTAGNAIINGYDIRRDMNEIYGMMGVCPQHDLLWDTLTGAEHLSFYGRLKGLKGLELEAAIEAALKSVNLFNDGVGYKRPSAAYSGGMKRRLSVAISFMGRPSVVYLDEPSTGLDPASRRNLWNVVKANKADRAIILTTHSMEEAEMLCDRLGIFVDGRLVCIGNPKEIASRYGDYLVFSISVSAAQEAAALSFVSGMAPSAHLTYSLAGSMKFELPTSEITAAAVFKAMESPAAQALGLHDWSVSSATLEEVFIKFARSINAKAAEMGH